MNSVIRLEARRLDNPQESSGSPIPELLGAKDIVGLEPMPQGGEGLEDVMPATRVRAKRRQVLVTSNCQVGGIGLCLRALLPDTDVHMLPVWDITPEAEAQTRAAIANADVWVTIMRDQALMQMAEGKQIVRIPYLNFPAFHPDVCYVRGASGVMVRCMGDSDYHSLLALWSYRAGLGVEQAKAMFRPEVFREIGYLDGWDSAIAAQRAVFASSALSFDDYIRPLISKVPFMHTPNHPDGMAIGQLSKLIARQITGDEAVMKVPLHYLVQDTLSHIATWPLYPAIAEQFGLDGCYIWKLQHGSFFTSLDHFLTETYAHYDRLDVSGWTCDRLENVELQSKLQILAGL